MSVVTPGPNLTLRRRAWALLCYAERGGDRVWRWDVPEVFAEAAEGVGLVEDVGDELVLTTDGRKAERETLLTGRVPTVVWLDPDEWRQQAWTAMRIHRRFSLEALLASGVVAHPEGLRGYLNTLEARGVVARIERLDQWLVTDDVGPEAPLPDAPRRGERSPSRPWRSRVRLVAARLGLGGGGFTGVDLRRLAGVEVRLVRSMLEMWEGEGRVVRVELLSTGLRTGGGARAWWWSLSGPGSLDDATEAGGAGGHRQVVWDRLCAGERLRVSDVAPLFGGHRNAERYLRQLVASEFATVTRGGLFKAALAEASPYPRGAHDLYQP